MGVNSLPKTATRQRHDCDSNPCSSEPESGTLTTRPPSHQGTVVHPNCMSAGLPITSDK